MFWIVIICILVYFDYRYWQRSGKKHWVFIGYNREDFENSHLGIKLRHPVKYDLIIGKRK